MDIRQLRYFIAVAECLSFTQAAKQLFISQPSLSQQIADLERHIGVSLLIRKHNGISLTNAGKALLKDAKIIVTKCSELIQHANEAETGIVGDLKIGILGYTEKQILPNIVMNFRQKYPRVNLSFEQFSLGSLDTALVRNDIDIGFTAIWEQHYLPNVAYKKIYKDSLCVVLPSNHALARESGFELSSIIDEPIVFQKKDNSPRGYNNLFRICINRDFYPKTTSMSDMWAVLLGVECGIGISILPSVIPKSYNSSRITCFNISGKDSQIDIAVAWNQTNFNPSIPLFVDELNNNNVQTIG